MARNSKHPAKGEPGGSSKTSSQELAARYQLARKKPVHQVLIHIDSFKILFLGPESSDLDPSIWETASFGLRAPKLRRLSL
jgi:hypothetical protein